MALTAFLGLFDFCTFEEVILLPNMDEKMISSFSGGLAEILTLELNAGNRICETYKGDWPYVGCVMLFLEKPFLTPIQRNIEDVVFQNVNDPHYWKSQYYDKKMNQFLCCKFDDR